MFESFMMMCIHQSCQLRAHSLGRTASFGAHYVWEKTDITYSLPPALVAGNQLTDVAGDGVLTWAAAGSSREIKNITGTVTDPNEALTQILGTPIYRFHYKPGMGTGDSATEYVGVIADEAPWAMHYDGAIVNPVNTLGYMVLGIQATNKKIEGLELKINDFNELNNFDKENSWRESLVAWFANIGNGIGDFFANRVHTKELCVVKSDGTEFCANGDQLEAMVGSSGGSSSGGNGSTGGNAGDVPGDGNTGAGATCSDGIQNQDEIDVDAGGICTDEEVDEPPVCETPQTLVNNACVDPEPENLPVVDDPASEPTPAPETTDPASLTE